jgi:hypothetical protein
MSHLMKKSAKVLHYFGLDCGMLEFFKHSTHEPSSKKQLLILIHFGTRYSEKIAVWTHTANLPKK